MHIPKTRCVYTGPTLHADIKTLYHVCWEACQLSALYLFIQLNVWRTTRFNYRYRWSMKHNFTSLTPKQYRNKSLPGPPGRTPLIFWFWWSGQMYGVMTAIITGWLNIFNLITVLGTTLGYAKANVSMSLNTNISHLERTIQYFIVQCWAIIK